VGKGKLSGAVEMITPKEFNDRMKWYFEEINIEKAHEDADKLIISLLKQPKFREYREGIEIFENMQKWYS
jgi:hypothetical protein